MSFSQSLNKCLDCGASLSGPVTFDLFPTNPSVTVSFGLRHWWARRVSKSDGRWCDFSANKLSIWMSYMSFCNFSSKPDGRRYDFFHLNTALPFQFKNSYKDSAPRLLRVFLRPPTKFRQYLATFSAIPCEPCSWKIEIFSGTVKFTSLIRGDL